MTCTTFYENTLSNGGNVSGCAEYSGKRICSAVAFSVYGFVWTVPIGFNISSSSSMMHTNTGTDTFSISIQFIQSAILPKIHNSKHRHSVDKLKFVFTFTSS